LTTLAARAVTEPRTSTVLVVEDELLVRLTAADALRSAGYIVLEAANADEAKALLMTFPDIALVFSDVQMPGTLNGLELADFIRATYPSVALILTSGTVGPEGAEEAAGFIEKPYAPEDIIERVGILLS
jgi:CheY-like chemotaxis protein